MPSFERDDRMIEENIFRGGGRRRRIDRCISQMLLAFGGKHGEGSTLG